MFVPQQSPGATGDREMAQFTTAGDLLKYTPKESIVRTDVGHRFKIQSIREGELLTQVTHAMKLFREYGLQNIAALVADTDFLEAVRAIVCEGVTSLTLVDKRQAECDPEKEEVSIDLIEPKELGYLFSKIADLTMSDDMDDIARI